MSKEIKYNGVSTSPSDYNCADGELLAALNLVNEDGAIKAVPTPRTEFSLPSQKKLVYIHKTDSFKHYIIRSQNVYIWIDADEVSVGQRLYDIDEWTGNEVFSQYGFNREHYLLRHTDLVVYNIVTVGNTLVFLTDHGVYYYLWKAPTYVGLGNHLPELPLSFGLVGERVIGDEFVTELDSLTGDDRVNVDDIAPLIGDYHEWTATAKNVLSNSVNGAVNSFIQTHNDYSHFMFPFFVRFAYKLYDGTYTMQSAPILMPCTTKQNPFVLGHLGLRSDDRYVHKLHMKIYAAVFSLDVAVVAQDYIDNLKNWGDIVESVDVFVSEPFFSYKQEAQCSGVRLLKSGFAGNDIETGQAIYYDELINNNLYNRDNYCVCKATHINGVYEYHSMHDFFASGQDSFPAYEVVLPLHSENGLNDRIKNNANFRLLKSFKLSELSTERHTITVPSGYLGSLATKEALPDDNNNSHGYFVAKYGYNYNARLHLANIYDVLPDTPYSKSMLCYSNGNMGDTSKTQTIVAFIFLKKDGVQYQVRPYDLASGLFHPSSEASFGRNAPVTYLYYPDPDAYKAVIWYRQTEGAYVSDVFKEVTLKSHSSLHGAYFFDGWNKTPGTTLSAFDTGEIPIASKSVPRQNDLIASEVNNPFAWPLSGRHSLAGDIYGICTAAKALSQGQFGQFPLYAFTSEGVWALEVNEDGMFRAKQPITRDVCINPESITQLESSVLFATARGLMIISGSDTVCISDIIYEDSNVGELREQISPVIQQETLDAIDIIPFQDYIKGCRAAFDYRHQRIVVFNPEISYAYVYSLKSKMWSMVHSNFENAVNSYPDALVQSTGHDVVNLSYDSNTIKEGLLVTRPLKLEFPVFLKTINRMIQRGAFEKGHVKTILYGSRDLTHWHLIASSKNHYLESIAGTAYSYFRIVLICELTKDERVVGCTIEAKAALTNKIR